MKNLLNNFKKNLNNNPQKTLLFILASFAFVELLALIYAINFINLNKTDKSLLDESKSWEYYILGKHLSEFNEALYYDLDRELPKGNEKKFYNSDFYKFFEEETIKVFGKYLVLDPTFKFSNYMLSANYERGVIFNVHPNICSIPIIDDEQVKNFQTLVLPSDIAYIKRGKIRFKLGDYQGASHDFQQAIDQNPENKNKLRKSIALAYFALANPTFDLRYRGRNLIYETHNPGFLFKEIKEHLDLINSEFNLERIRSNVEANNAIKAGIFPLSMIEDLTNAIRNDPFFYKNYPVKINNPCIVFSDEYPILIETLNKKIETNPNSSELPELYYKRALIYLDSGNNQKAIEDLNKVLQLSSTEDSLKALTYYSRWLVHYKEKKYQQSINDISQVIKIYPDFPDFYAIRGLTYYDFLKLSKNTKDIEKVIEDSNHAIKLHEELLKKLNPRENSRLLGDRPHANAYFIRGLAYYDQGNRTQALLDYLKALQFWSGSMWPSIINRGGEGGGVKEIQLPPGFPP